MSSEEATKSGALFLVMVMPPWSCRLIADKSGQAEIPQGPICHVCIALIYTLHPIVFPGDRKRTDNMAVNKDLWRRLCINWPSQYVPIYGD